MRRVIACVLLLPLIQIRDAEACGCFAQPSPTTPVVQAGERILFAHDGNQVVAYIQIQYQGKADNQAAGKGRNDRGRTGSALAHEHWWTSQKQAAMPAATIAKNTEVP